MTPDENLALITKKLEQLDEAALVYGPATAVHDQMTQRLFEEGIMGDESKIGGYSTEPAYYSQSQFKNGNAFKGKGKTGKAKFKNGQEHKSMYLQSGYKELKGIQGYVNSFVNLNYSGELRREFATKLAVEGNTVVLRLANELNIKKVNGLTGKYGNTLFKHTEEERQFFKKETTKDLIDYLNA